jgi:hypothetical protein
MDFGMVTVALPTHRGKSMNREIPCFARLSGLVINEAVVVLMLGAQGHLPDESLEQCKENIRVRIAEIEWQATQFSNHGGKFLAQVVGRFLGSTDLWWGSAVRQTVACEYGKYECGRLRQGSVAMAVTYANKFGLFGHGSVQA